MKALLQRVSRASVQVQGERIAEIGPGLLVLLGIAPADGEAELSYLVKKILQLRVFTDEAGKMNLSVMDVAGGLLVVSQFTLYAEVHKGNRPAFTAAAPPQQAKALYDTFLHRLSQQYGGPIAQGKFGANMQVSLVNNGPVTILVDTDLA